ncbi:MAG: hypothetical protein K2J13_05370 [Clostridia bacterium]|nr:hypothetical protein [Clostridia bacterium]
MQNEPKQIVITRPTSTPKLKNDPLTIVLKLLLLGSIFFANYFSAKQNYNSLFAYVIDPTYGDYFNQITGMSAMQSMAMFESGAMAISIKIFAPLVISAIILLLYTFLYAKFFAYLIFNQFIVLDLSFDIRKFRICLDVSIILLAVLMGISRVIFNIYPIAGNLGRVIVDPIFAIISLATFFFLYTRGMEKKYYPILLNIMLMPAIILVVIV